MTHLGSFSVRLERSRPARRRCSRRGQPARRGWAVLAVPAMVLATLAAGVAPAGAQTTQSVVGTAAVAVRSVSVTPTSFAIGGCALDATPGILQFPNDTCDAGTFSVTNGTAPSHMDLKISAFVPADNGRAWGPCGASGNSACAGTGGLPGVNQFSWTNQAGEGFGTGIHCDEHVAPLTSTCPVTPSAEVDTDHFALVGPLSSSDLSPTFQVTLTWTAAP